MVLTVLLDGVALKKQIKFYITCNADMYTAEMSLIVWLINVDLPRTLLTSY